jgi:hypothetical protein
MNRKIVAVVFLCVMAFVAGRSWPAAAAGGTDKLAQARVDAAAKAYAAALTHWKAGQVTADVVYLWSVRWFVAEREQPLTGKKLATAAADHLARMTELETQVEAMFKAGAVSEEDVDAATYYVAEAAVWNARGGKP